MTSVESHIADMNSYLMPGSNYAGSHQIKQLLFNKMKTMDAQIITSLHRKVGRRTATIAESCLAAVHQDLRGGRVSIRFIQTGQFEE